jgi:SAM-dependent methyltransferase
MQTEDRSGDRFDPTAHWEGVYQRNDPTRLTWFQPSPEESLRMIEAAALDRDARIIDVGGGTSSLVDHLLDVGHRKIGVLDVSRRALEVTRARLVERAALVEWFEGDVTHFRSPHPWDLWHDRAVLHFLLEDEDRLAYRQSLLGALAVGGQAVIATFGPDGPTRCSGLDVRRYDPESLLELLGTEFDLLESVIEMHTTPSCSEQQFLFCRVVRREVGR